MEDSRPQTKGQTTIKELASAPKEGMRTVFDVVEAMSEGEGGTKLVIERRALNPEPATEGTRKESAARAHTFFAAAGFIAYLKRYGSKNTVVFADSDSRQIQAVIDEEAKGQREVVTLRPQTHPRWEPWRSLLGRKLSLDDFRELITENRKAITAPDGRGLILAMRQIRMSTEVQLQSGVMRGDAAAVNGIIIRSKVTGGGADSDTLALPESITVRSAVLVDEPEQDIEMDLILSGNREGNEIRCQLSSADIREAEIASFDGLIGRLRVELEPEEFVVTHGAFNQTRWERV